MRLPSLYLHDFCTQLLHPTQQWVGQTNIAQQHLLLSECCPKCTQLLHPTQQWVGQTNIAQQHLSLSECFPKCVNCTSKTLCVAHRQWTVEQIEAAKKGTVVVLYASAYGNTAGMAQAISRGITKAGIAVETLNLEVDSVEDALEAMKKAKGFIIGSPTLGGHLPTQVSSPNIQLSEYNVQVAWHHTDGSCRTYCVEQAVRRNRMLARHGGVTGIEQKADLSIAT